MKESPDTFFAAAWQTLTSAKTARIVVLITIGLIIFLIRIAPAMINDVISKSPDVADSKAAIVAVKAVADQANGKADRLLQTQEKIFSALKDQTRATNDVTQAVVQVSTQVSLLGKQMDRLENRQDGVFDHSPVK